MNYQEMLYSPITPPHILPFIQKASQSIVPVFIQGEPGTGKEWVAKMIHYTGVWKDHPFHKIDCKMSAENKPHDPLHRFLLGFHREMTPATIYLKGVEFLGQSDQFKLLELLELMENGVLQNLRLISSSSDHLKEKVNQRNFSEDLYRRLSILLIHLPPLRERAQEIPKISQYILEEYSQRMKMDVLRISDSVLQLLKSYWWPGNLRELEQVIIRSIVFSEDNRLSEKDFILGTENDIDSFASFLKTTELHSMGTKEKDIDDKNNIPSLSLFLIELAHRIKNPLVSIKTFTQLIREKFDDAEFREYFFNIVTEDIEKIDSLLNRFLDYIKISTPIQKTNTINHLLEAIFKENTALLENKKIKLLKKLDHDLPETTVPNVQVRYILNSVLQYAIPIIPPFGKIGFLTKTLDLHKKAGTDQPSLPQESGWVEILIGFTGFKKYIGPFDTLLGTPNTQGEETIDLELRLVKELVQKNGGRMKFKIDENIPRTLISLRFPIDRRKVFHYQSIDT